MSTDKPFDENPYTPPADLGRLVGGRRQVVLRQVSVLSLAKFQAVVMLGFGLIVSGFMMLGLLLGLSVGGPEGDVLPLLGGSLVGVLVLVLVYPIIGFVSGAIGAVIFNLASGVIGGIRIELGPVDD